jgi:hypothetical protein
MTSQSSTGSAEGHVVDRLAEYFGGSLVAADESVVDAHLLFCAECRTEYDELGAVALAVALQPAGTLDGETTTVGSHVPATRQPPAQPSRGSSGPGRTTGAGPAGRSRRAGVRRLAGYAVALVAGAAIGIGAMALVNQPDTTPLLPVGGNQDISTDRLSVTLVEAATGTEVRVAAVGVPPSRGFQVIAGGTWSRPGSPAAACCPSSAPCRSRHRRSSSSRWSRTAAAPSWSPARADGLTNPGGRPQPGRRTPRDSHRSSDSATSKLPQRRGPRDVSVETSSSAKPSPWSARGRAQRSGPGRSPS